MKRYLRLILLCFFIVIVIGAFYIQLGMASGDKINFTFEKVKGDEKEIDNLVINADYKVGSLNKNIKISNNETIHSDHLNFIQKISLDYQMEPIFENLKKQYKSFMRGKGYLPNYFYEDDQFLAYVGDKKSREHLYFVVDILNKKSGKRTSFKIEEKVYDFISIEDVQMKNDSTLQVLVRAFKNNGLEELCVYTFNISTQKLEKDESIIKGKANTTVRVFTDDSISKNNYAVIRTEPYDISGEEPEKNKKHPEVYIYDFEKNQLKKMKLLNNDMNYTETISVYDSTLFVGQDTAEGTEIYSYDIVKEKWNKKPVFRVTVDAQSYYYTKIMNGKIYVFYSKEKENWLLVGDLQTGKILYEGKIKAENGTDIPIQVYNVALDI